MANRVVLGRALSGGSPVYGLFVSRPGVDVIDGSGELADTEDLLFDSRLSEQSNIIKAGSVAFGPGPGTRTSPYIYHKSDMSALPYVPIVVYNVLGSTIKSMPSRCGSSTVDPSKGGYSTSTTTVADWIQDLTNTRFRISVTTGMLSDFTLTGHVDAVTIHYWVLALGDMTPIAVP